MYSIMSGASEITVGIYYRKEKNYCNDPKFSDR